MYVYDKKRAITFGGKKYKIVGWDVAGYINSRGVRIDQIEGGGVLLRFNHYEKGESGKRTYMSQEKYDEIADGYNPYDTLHTWTMPFLDFIAR